MLVKGFGGCEWVWGCGMEFVMWLSNADIEL